MNYYEPFANFEVIANKSYIKDRADGGKFTIVTIKAPTGEKYSGTAIINPEDMDHFRPLTGYRIAENRAYIKYLKDRLMKIKYHKWVLNYLQVKDTAKSGSVYSNREQRDINHKIIEMSKEIKDIKRKILNTYKLIDDIVAERWKVIDKIEARAEKNQKRQELVDAIRAGQNS